VETVQILSALDRKALDVANKPDVDVNEILLRAHAAGIAICLTLSVNTRRKSTRRNRRHKE
jgi:hypothetical protein